MPSSTMLKAGVRLKLCGRRRQTAPSDDDVLNVAGYRLRGRAWIVVVVHARRHCTISSMLAGCEAKELCGC